MRGVVGESANAARRVRFSGTRLWNFASRTPRAAWRTSGIVHWTMTGPTGLRGENWKMRHSIWVAALALLPTQVPAQTAPPATQVFEKVCGACHAIEIVTDRKSTRLNSSHIP